jgi:competence protein ComEC
MVVSVKFPPILGLVSGAALSYYGFCLFRENLSGSAVLAFLFFPVLLICLFRVLARFPGEIFAPSRRRRSFALGELYMTAIALGLAFGFGAAGAVPRNAGLGIPEEAVAGLSGVLLDDPRAVTGGRGLASLSLREAAGRGGIQNSVRNSVRSSARGLVTVFFPDEAMPRLREFGRGSVVYLEGNFVAGGTSGAEKNRPPLPGERPLFRASAVHVVRPAPALEQFRTGLRLELIRLFTRGSAPGAAGGHSAAAGGWGGLALALLLGIRDNLDTDLSELYRKAGSSHILALSGMHLAIISALIAFCLKRPLGLKAAAVCGALFIILYVFLVGAQPSLNRAALMYILGTLAVLGALPRSPGVLLGLAFLIQVAIWPESGLSISFILSYLALAGILSVGESLSEIFRGKIPEFLLQPLSASLGAFSVTAGVTAVFFGALYPIGIIAGLLIVPLTTVFMIASMGWLLLCLAAPPLSVLTGQGLALLYRFMDRLVTLAAGVPGMSVSRPFWILGLSLVLPVLVICFGSWYGGFKRRLLPFA